MRIKMLKNYKDLKVWQKSYGLCLDIYRITRKFPKKERYGLTSQIRRSAVSVPSNIAEGYGRKTTAGYIRSLYISYRSNCELETQALLSGDLDYFEAGKLAELIDKIAEVERVLKALIKSLEKNTWPLESLNPRILVCLRQACMPCSRIFYN
ncbi:MAG: four helix bundle protein [Deltaproteobacteria bacterium]|nr:four helix bundle protein [Deltaproteobacteria bacterium]